MNQTINKNNETKTMKYEINNIDAEIPVGKGNVILSKWRCDAPIFAIRGGGSKQIKAYLKGMGFRYNSISHGWLMIDLFCDNAIAYLTNKLTASGYTVVNKIQA